MRVLSDSPSGPDQGFDARDADLGNPLAPLPARSRKGPDLIRVAILLSIVVILALVVSIIAVSVRPNPVEVVSTAGDELSADEQSAAVPIGADIDADLRVPAMFATQFAHSYLNFSEADPGKRAANLVHFLAPGLDPQLGWSGAGSQAAGVLMPLRATREGDRIDVTVTAFVSGTPYSRWVHLAVPLAEGDDGRLAVIGTPVYVPAPPVADVEPLSLPEADPDLSSQLRPLVAAAMEAYGASDVVAVSGITAPGRAIHGLGGLYAMSSLDTLTVSDGGDERRTAIAEVSWDTDAIGGPLRQEYLLDLVRLDGAWVVAGIGPR